MNYVLTKLKADKIKSNPVTKAYNLITGGNLNRVKREREVIS